MLNLARLVRDVDSFGLRIRDARHSYFKAVKDFTFYYFLRERGSQNIKFSLLITGMEINLFFQ